MTWQAENLANDHHHPSLIVILGAIARHIRSQHLPWLLRNSLMSLFNRAEQLSWYGPKTLDKETGVKEKPPPPFATKYFLEIALMLSLDSFQIWCPITDGTVFYYLGTSAGPTRDRTVCSALGDIHMCLWSLLDFWRRCTCVEASLKAESSVGTLRRIHA